MQSIYTSPQMAAISHLRMLQVEKNPAQDRIYVRLAYTYGIEIPTIADESGLSVASVRDLILA